MPDSASRSVPNDSVLRRIPGLFNWGMFWLFLATLGTGLFLSDGLGALLHAWQLPEYSHGPLIPVLSALLFLRQLKEVPENPGPVDDRWPGVAVIAAAFALGALGKLSNIPDIVAYSIILWVGGVLLISFGWTVGKHFWPPVLHLVYMLPLPDTIYYKATTALQLISSELGVWFLRLMNVPVFLEGNIIDLGVLKLHVAEACSGLNYMFPILSFSYIFAVLYRGPMWHKAVLLVSAVPITVLMNSVRIAIAGMIANTLGTDSLEGFSHFFEGWVIFIICICILFALAWFMLFLRRDRLSLVDALDLDTSGWGTQAMRLRHLRASPALITAAGIAAAALLAWQAVPDSRSVQVERDSFSVFPRSLGDWRQVGAPDILEPAVADRLQADDYHSINLQKAGAPADVGLFMAWYQDQTDGGVHSPEICLPGAGWEIAWLERSDLSSELGLSEPFNLNRAIIQKGETRMLVYYWFQQGSRTVAWDISAKFYLLVDGIKSGQTDGGMIRLTTLIDPGETDAAAEDRLQGVMHDLLPVIPRFMPED